MGKRAKRLERMVWRLARTAATYRRALQKSANDAQEVLDKYGERKGV
jgi:hypothetical protein